ncbi:MAG: hypothetical protein JXR89_02050 [Deltaproteobacteria bacterium]|nr:hypothetical protein [Deltaproteobacteria bacterium]
MIRTTANHFFMSVESNLSRINEQRNRYLQQVSTGKNFYRISEAPVAATAVLTYEAEDVKISQMARNMLNGDNQLAVVGTAADQVHATVSDAKTALKAWETTQDDGMQGTIIQQMRQFEEQLYGHANTVSNGGSIFAGFQRRAEETYGKVSTDTFHLGAVYNGDGGQLAMEVGIMQTLQINVVGGGYTLDGRQIEGFFSQEKTKDGDARDVFELFSRIIAGFEDDSIETYQTSSEYPLSAVRNLVAGDLELVFADGSTTAIPATYAGAAAGVEAAAANAANINSAGTGVTALLRAQVTAAAPLPNFATGDPLTMVAGDLTINDVAIGAVEFVEVSSADAEAGNNAALQNIRALASAINFKSDETGVWATYTPENDSSSPHEYSLVLTANEANGEIIRVELANDAHTQTGLGTAAGTTDYHPGHDGPPRDAANTAADAGNTNVYYSNNGAVTLESETNFVVRELNGGALTETLGLTVNGGLDRHETKSLLDQRIAEMGRYLDNFVNERAAVAARRNHIESSQESMDVRAKNLADAVDNIETVVMEEAILKYYAAQNYYEATLASTTRVINTSILNYM